jgi:Reverse transcriptase (RNA-dependent DNA polymerase)
MIFAPATLEKWVIHGMDVITAYLLKLNEMYMVQPEGFARMAMKNLVYRSLYGLKQAAHVWNQKINSLPHQTQRRIHLQFNNMKINNQH